MPRVPIYPRRHTLYAHIAVDVAEALSRRARAEQVPQRAVVEAALRQYLGPEQAAEADDDVGTSP
jgi:hypothetical protein